jgi:hypothetical protein
MSDDKDKTPAPATDQTTPAAPDKEKKEDSKAAASGWRQFQFERLLYYFVKYLQDIERHPLHASYR